MDNQLIVTNSDNFDSFIAKLNEAIGFREGLPIIPNIKFDAQIGKFMRETGERDEDNKPIYEELGDKLQMHIITTRKMVQTKHNVEPVLFSREFMDNYVELYNENKQVVLKGFYKDLKSANPNLKFIQVLYVIVDDKPYRLKLSGSKLQSLFPYLASFVNDSYARFITLAEKGDKTKNGAVEYYELNFSRGGEITDRELIVKRVNDINFYLMTIAKAKSSEYHNTDLPQHDVLPSGYDEEIDVDSIPMN